MGLQQEILKTLVMEYQRTRSGSVFSKILERVDKLLLYILHRHVRRRNIEKVDMRDLYHSSIVGLGRAILTSPQNELPDKVVARIIAYVRLQIDTDYWDKHKPSDDKRIPLKEAGLIEKDKYIITNSEFSTVLSEILVKMITRRVITKQEAILYLKRKMFNVEYKLIANALNVTEDGARKHMIRVERKIDNWVLKNRICKAVKCITNK